MNDDARAIKKTWDKVVTSDLRVLGLDRRATKDSAARRTTIKQTKLTHVSVY